MFLLLTVERTCRGKQLVDIAPRQLSVMIVTVKLRHVEIHRAVAFIGISAFEYLLHILNLLYDMT